VEKILNDYQTMPGNKVQLSIVNKKKLPITIEVQSEYIFDINLKGKYVIILVHLSIVTTINHSGVARGLRGLWDIAPHCLC